VEKIYKIRNAAVGVFASLLFCLPLSLQAAVESCKAPSQIKAADVNPDIDTSFLGSLLPSSIKFDTVNHADVAKFLGWVDGDTKTENFCNGYYLEPDIITTNPNPLPFDLAPTKVTADKPALFSQYGTSTLTGDVTITQPGRQITSDIATFYREADTGKISSGTLLGNVHLREYGKIIVAKKGLWDSCTHAFTLTNGIYRMITPSPTGSVNAWGRASKMVRDDKGVLTFNKATYTTCSPKTNTWRVRGSKIVLNKNTGRGSVTNALIFFHDFPVAYLPYFNFPIDKDRKSGFLYPSFSFSSNNGVDLSLPFYLNLAPNYDALLTSRVMGKRGILGEGLFRYLTPRSKGYLDMRYISRDTEFINFQKESLTTYQKPSYSLSRLENASADRGFISYQNETNFNEHWSGDVNVNYVSDDYFFQDFGGSPTNDDDQLFNQADVKYAGENWNFSALAQAFQTLHPINQSPSSADQYRRVPQINFNGNLPDSYYGLDYQLQGEFVNFDYDHEYDPLSGKLMATGNRVYLNPSASLPMNWAGGYATPQVQLDSTLYSLRNNVVDFNSGETKNNITRALPIFSFDSGMTLTRNTSLFSSNYMQTLEPRVFYLYVPDHNQSDIPIFDSALSTFSFDQLFATNRFSGRDLVGDANQISVGLTTRLLDSYSAEEKFRASIGQMYLLRKHDVCINSNCSSDPMAQYNVSPVVGEIQYDLTPYWSANVNAAWDPNINKFNNGAVNIKYHNGTNRIASLGYNFVKHGDPLINEVSDDLNRINLSVAWPIAEHWNAVGDWNYNISHDHPQEYFYGLEYQSCCWAVRVVKSQSFIGTDENNHNTFQKAVYMQVLLKGMGSVGSCSAGTLLTSQIPEYRDNFGGMQP